MRTNLDAVVIASHEAIEQAFRAIKIHTSRDPPVDVDNTERVHGHVFLCMFAWYVAWHMRQSLAPLLFEDDDRKGARARRTSPVEWVEVPEWKEHGQPQDHTRWLLADLATLNE